MEALTTKMTVDLAAVANTATMVLRVTPNNNRGISPPSNCLTMTTIAIMQPMLRDIATDSHTQVSSNSLWIVEDCFLGLGDLLARGRSFSLDKREALAAASVSAVCMFFTPE
jgi:hypothetical protein